MRDPAAYQSLPEEQKRGDGHEFQRRTLRVAYRHGRGACGYCRAAVPAEIVELAEGEKHGRSPTEQEDETKRAVDERTGGGGITGQRLVRKVVGIGVRGAGTHGRRSPSRPGEEGSQLTQLSRIAHCLSRE